MKKSFFIYLVALIIVTGIFGYVVLSQRGEVEENNTNAKVIVNTTDNTNTVNTNTVVNTNTSIDTSGWLTYQSSKYGYEVKYSNNGSYVEKDSGIENRDDNGYIVDFVIEEIGIRITVYGNTNNIRTLEELLESNLPLFIEVNEEYEEIFINGNRAFRFNSYLKQNSGQKKVGANTIFLTESYYYQITTGNQFTPEFTPQREEIYNVFINTFKLMSE